jgi:hypothetical protein
VRTDDPARALRLFKSNSWAGLLLVLAIVAGARLFIVVEAPLPN